MCITYRVLWVCQITTGVCPNVFFITRACILMFRHRLCFCGNPRFQSQAPDPIMSSCRHSRVSYTHPANLPLTVISEAWTQAGIDVNLRLQCGYRWTVMPAVLASSRITERASSAPWTRHHQVLARGHLLLFRSW